MSATQVPFALPVRALDHSNFNCPCIVDVNNFLVCFAFTMGGAEEVSDCINNHAALVEALRAAQSVLWMAEKYAEDGGSRGPEIGDYEDAMKKIDAADELLRKAGEGK